jgi:twitching motility protein PilI
MTGAAGEGGRESGRDPASRRSRLRAYQEQLLEKMQAAKNGAGVNLAQLGLGIGAARYLIDLGEAGEIVAPPPVTAVPLTQSWYLGLANVRGSLLGVIDLGQYFGLEDAASAPAPGATPRLVVFAPKLGFNCALLASQVYGLRQAANMEREGDTLRDADGNAWTPLSLAALVQEPRFLHVAR